MWCKHAVVKKTLKMNELCAVNVYHNSRIARHFIQTHILHTNETAFYVKQIYFNHLISSKHIYSAHRVRCRAGALSEE